MVLVRDFREVEARPAIEGVTMRVLIGPQEEAPFFNMRLFEVQPGHSTFHHSHWWEHEIFILEGQGVVVTDQGERPFAPGSVVFVPGGELHQFQNRGEGLLRFLCLVPQEWLHDVEQPGL